jgi:hypothetical protein
LQQHPLSAEAGEFLEAFITAAGDQERLRRGRLLAEVLRHHGIVVAFDFRNAAVR